MIEQLIKIFDPLNKGVETYFKKRQLNKEERLDMRDKLSKASMETRKAFVLLKSGKEISINLQYEIADLWRKAFIVISEKHPDEAYTLMGKSNSWLTPGFWKENEQEMLTIEKNLEMVDLLIMRIK